MMLNSPGAGDHPSQTQGPGGTFTHRNGALEFLPILCEVMGDGLETYGFQLKREKGYPDSPKVGIDLPLGDSSHHSLFVGWKGRHQERGQSQSRYQQELNQSSTSIPAKSSWWDPRRTRSLHHGFAKSHGGLKVLGQNEKSR